MGADGEILRPQREAEAAEDFERWVAATDGTDDLNRS
jgi:hypothetical protein